MIIFSGILQEKNSIDDIGEMSSKMSTAQLDKASPSPPVLKLPQLFSLTPNSSGKGGNVQKRYSAVSQTSHVENPPERKSAGQPMSNNHVDNLPLGFLHFSLSCTRLIIC